MAVNYWYKSGEELLSEINKTSIPEDSIALWFLGQESMVIKSGADVLYIDPFFTDLVNSSGMSSRIFPPPFAPKEIKNAHWVICSHNHIDHIDPGTLAPMSENSPNARFIVPVPHVKVLENVGIDGSRIIGARAGKRLELTDQLTVMPVAAAHEEYQTDENGDHLHLGYIINLNGVKVYHAGDTVETEEMVDTLKKFDIDVACLPINGADWLRRRQNTIGNMNAREAANVAAECGADIVIPLHYDLFAGNGENPAHFVDYMHQYYPAKKSHVMVPGERFIYMK